MMEGFVKVFSIAGTILALFIVLCIVGMVNQHDQVSMNAVLDGLGDVFKWIGELIGEGVKHI